MHPIDTITLMDTNHFHVPFEPRYEKLCSIKCIQTRDTNFGVNWIWTHLSMSAEWNDRLSFFFRGLCLSLRLSAHPFFLSLSCPPSSPHRARAFAGSHSRIGPIPILWSAAPIAGIQIHIWRDIQLYHHMILFFYTPPSLSLLLEPKNIDSFLENTLLWKTNASILTHHLT